MDSPSNGAAGLLVEKGSVWSTAGPQGPTGRNGAFLFPLDKDPRTSSISSVLKNQREVFFFWLLFKSIGNFL